MRIHLPQLMVALVVTTLLGSILSLTLPAIRAVPTAILLHMIFAVGALPMILGAMTYFVPVLTRTGAPTRRELIPPLAALFGGFVLIFSLWQAFHLIPLAAAIDLLAVLWLSRWIQQRRNRCLGSPHPGLLWYQLALGAISLALIAIIAGYFWPEQWLAFRRFHLHLNLLGFIGITALSTLRVLLPTTTKIHDSNSAKWLSDQWPWMVLGILAIATGSAWYAPGALIGLLLLAFPLLTLARAMIVQQWHGIHKLHGAAPALGIALVGFLTCLLVSGVHIHGLLSGSNLALLFILIFILPLVTGAGSHLIPLWMPAKTGGISEKRSRQTLGRYSALRCATFFASGILLIAGYALYYLPALAALLHFLYLIATHRHHKGNSTP